MTVNIGQVLAVVLGITSTMPIVGIPLGAQYIGIFNIAFVLNFIFIVQCWMKKTTKCRIVVTKEKRTFTLFLLWDVVSVIVGLWVLPQEWDTTIISYLIKAFQFLIFAFFVDQCVEKHKIFRSFFVGFIVGCFGNVFWSIAEFLGYKLFSIRLNDMIFSSYAKQLSRSTLITTEYGVRTAGFNYDPAHLGGILPIAFGWSMINKKPWLAAACLVALAFSQSSTALVGCAIVFVGVLFVNGTNVRSVNVKRFQIRKSTAFVFFAAIIIVLIALNKNEFISASGSLIKNNAKGFLLRIKDVYLSAGKESLRELYYKNAFWEVLKRGIISITGTGIGSSGYAYYSYPGIASQGIFDVESVYLSYLFGTGIVGLLLYGDTLIGIMKKTMAAISYNKNKFQFEKEYFLALLSIISCGFFYHYTLTAYQTILIIFVITNLERNRDIKSECISTSDHL